MVDALLYFIAKRTLSARVILICVSPLEKKKKKKISVSCNHKECRKKLIWFKYTELAKLSFKIVR